MQITKYIKSKRGNEYIIDLFSTGDETFTYIVKNINGEIIQEGYWGFYERYKGKNPLIESIKDIVSLIENRFSDHETLKSFEEWDGVIEL